MTKLSSGASSGIIAFGSTKAPVESSSISGVEGEDNLDVNTTFAKCVGTETFGGDPMTSWICTLVSLGKEDYRGVTNHAPFAV
jgi:hypothetical protein